jgi:hypothetical protein
MSAGAGQAANTLVGETAKFQPRFVGTFEIVGHIRSDTLRHRTTGREFTGHSSQLKIYEWRCEDTSANGSMAEL